MTKRICKQCGVALSKGAKFCTSCGATASVVETAGAFAPETRPLPREQADQTVPGKAGPTEELPSTQTAAQRPPSSYDTEEIPQTSAAPRSEEKSMAVGAEAPVTHRQTERAALAKQASGARKGLLLVTALGVVALVAGAFFFAGSRESPETQATNQPANGAKPSASAQPIAQPSGQPSVSASNQAQPQTEAPNAPASGEIKSPTTQNADAGSKAPHTRGEAKPTPAASREKQADDGTGAAQHNFNQGIAQMSAGRYQDALREFEYVKKLDPGNKSVYYLIGQTYHKMGQLDRALEAYRQCTSGVYASVAQTHVKTLEKKAGKTN